MAIPCIQTPRNTEHRVSQNCRQTLIMTHEEYKDLDKTTVNCLPLFSSVINIAELCLSFAQQKFQNGIGTRTSAVDQ